MMRPGKISEGEGYAYLVRNIGRQDIDVLKERPTMLKYYLKVKMRKRNQSQSKDNHKVWGQYRRRSRKELLLLLHGSQCITFYGSGAPYKGRM